MSNFKFNFWNDDTEHYEYAATFKKAISDCEIVYEFEGPEWEVVKASNDFAQLKGFLDSKDIECEIMEG